MKRIRFFGFAAAFVALSFCSCSKDNNFQTNSSAVQNGAAAMQSAGIAATTTDDRIDAIMKDLSVNSYSLNFDQAMPESGITRTAYGVDNYLAFADPQILKCSKDI